MKLALDTQRDFQVYLKSQPASGGQARAGTGGEGALGSGEGAGSRGEAGAGGGSCVESDRSSSHPTVIRRASISIAKENLSPQGSIDEAYVPSTSAQARDLKEREAILQAILDLEAKKTETEEPSASESLPVSQEGEAGAEAPQEAVGGGGGGGGPSRGHNHKVGGATHPSLDSMTAEEGSIKALHDVLNDVAMDSMSSDHLMMEQALNALSIKGGRNQGQGQTSLLTQDLHMDSFSSCEQLKLRTSSRLKEELERAALEQAKADLKQHERKVSRASRKQAEAEARKQGLGLGLCGAGAGARGLGSDGDSDYSEYSDSALEKKAKEMAPFGGPMDFKLKQGYIQTWLSSDDHNLEDLLERRKSRTHSTEDCTD